MKLIVDEAESDALVDQLASDRQLIASWLLHTDMHCAAGRHPDAVDIDLVGIVLDTVNLVDLTRGDMISAGTHAPHRCHDAIHVAVAIRLGVDDFATCDVELARAAKAAGPTVLSPLS